MFINVMEYESAQRTVRTKRSVIDSSYGMRKSMRLRWRIVILIRNISDDGAVNETNMNGNHFYVIML